MAFKFAVMEDGRIEADWGSGTAYVRVTDEGDLRVTGIEIPDPTADKLRRVPLARIENALRRYELILRAGVDITLEGPPEKRFKLKRPAGKRLGDDFYKDVARAYRDAVWRGLNPRKTIAADTGAADATVAAWIMEARKPERGYLPPAEPGKVSA